MKKEKSKSPSGRGRLRRLLSAGISAMLFLSTFAAALPETEVAAYYDVQTKTQENTTLGTLGIKNPVVNDEAWKGNYVYFGAYNHDGDKTDMKFRVLDNDSTDFSGGGDTHTLFLDSDEIVWYEKFVDDEIVEIRTNSWKDSTLRSKLNGSFLDSFTDPEAEAIVTSTKGTASSDGHGWENTLNWTPLEGDKVFLLDAKEATNESYGYEDDSGYNQEYTMHAVNSRKKSGDGDNLGWWLRSARDDSDGEVGYVRGVSDDCAGAFDVHDVSTTPEPRGVSPALNIDRSRVLFATDLSIREMGEEEYRHNFVLTLLDEALSAKVTGSITRVGNKITIPYSVTRSNAGGEYDTINRVSVLVTDKDYKEDDAKIIKYDAISEGETFSSEGTGSFVFTDAEAQAYDAAADHRVYVIAEHTNVGQEIGYTDYASKPDECDVTKDVPAPKDTKITFDPNGGKVTPTSGVTGEDGKLTIKLPTPTRDGYKADGWWTQKDGGEQVDDSTVYTKGCTIYAHWKELPPKEHTITIAVEGRGTAVPNKTSAVKGENINIAVTPVAGWEFVEWKVNSGSVTVKDNAFTMPDENVELTAIFKEIPVTEHSITVIYDSKKGTAKADKTKAASGTKIKLTSSPKAGYKLTKWKVKAGGVKISNNSFTMPDKDVEIEAVFEKISDIKHKITVKTNGHGSAKASAAKAAKGKKVTVRATSTTGYRFKKWKAVTKGVVLADETKSKTTFTMPAKAVTVQALFESVVEPPMLILKPTGRDSIVAKWRKVTGAYAYEIYFSRCNHDGKKIEPKLVKTVKANEKLTWTFTGLSSGTAYKAYIRAYAKDGGKKKYLSTSPTMHVFTEGGDNVTYEKKIELGIKSVKIKKGKKYLLKPEIILNDPSKKVMSDDHAPALRYMSTNPGIAKVSSQGRITGVAPGKCHIYIFSHNGASKRLPVTVKK